MHKADKIRQPYKRNKDSEKALQDANLMIEYHNRLGERLQNLDSMERGTKQS